MKQVIILFIIMALTTTLVYAKCPDGVYPCDVNLPNVLPPVVSGVTFNNNTFGSNETDPFFRAAQSNYNCTDGNVLQNITINTSGVFGKCYNVAGSLTGTYVPYAGAEEWKNLSLGKNTISILANGGILGEEVTFFSPQPRDLYIQAEGVSTGDLIPFADNSFSLGGLGLLPPHTLSRWEEAKLSIGITDGMGKYLYVPDYSFGTYWWISDAGLVIDHNLTVKNYTKSTWYCNATGTCKDLSQWGGASTPLTNVAFRNESNNMINLNASGNITALNYCNSTGTCKDLSLWGGSSSSYNSTYHAKADYQFTNNNFNGSGDFITTGLIHANIVNSSMIYSGDDKSVYPSVNYPFVSNPADGYANMIWKPWTVFDVSGLLTLIGEDKYVSLFSSPGFGEDPGINNLYMWDGPNTVMYQLNVFAEDLLYNPGFIFSGTQKPFGIGLPQPMAGLDVNVTYNDLALKVQGNTSLDGLVYLAKLTQPTCGTLYNGSIIRNQSNCLNYCNGIAWSKIAC